MANDPIRKTLQRARRRQHPCDDQCQNHWCRHLAYVQDVAARVSAVERRQDELAHALEARRQGAAWLEQQLQALAEGQRELYRRLDWLRQRLDEEGDEWKHGTTAG